MRRFVTLVLLLLFSVSFGISISGCAKKSTPVVYCNGEDSGAVVGQLATISLTPLIYGISLNYAEIGSVTSPAGKDCKGNAVSVSSYTYGIVDANGKPNMTIADVDPSGTSAGKLCGGTWNRDTGGGIADFTTCNPNNITGTVYVVASSGNVSSNPLPIYVHPVVNSVVLGALSVDCINDPATNCSPAAFINSQTTCPINAANGCCTTPVTTTSLPLNTSTGCISQGVTGQIAARVYAGTGSAQSNISCEVGHLTYSAQTGGIVSIDQNGVATAEQPGSTTISANISNAGSSAGFFATCPPASIQLSVPPAGGTSVSVAQNNTQPITATVLDTNGVSLTGLALDFVSTTPKTIPAATGSVTPTYPGAAAITAICLPPACNPAPFNQIGLYGNGKPVTSNPVEVTAPGLSSTVLYMGSTQSQYIVPVDFTTSTLGTPVRLPFVPNSMVISNDGSTIYMGTSEELMTFSALTNTLTAQDASVMGQVLTVSPNNSTLVFTDPIRQMVYLYNSGGGVATSYGGIATSAEFTPDSSTVYITLGTADPAVTVNPVGNPILNCPVGDVAVSTVCVIPNNQMLVHSSNIGWYVTNTTSQAATNVAVTVPSVGAFFAGKTTVANGYCPVTTQTTVDGQPTTTNVFYPDAGVSGPVTDQIVATNDGLHILGAHAASSLGTFTDLLLGSSNAPGVPTGACPGNSALAFTTTPAVANAALSGITPTSITGVDVASDSSIAFVTYLGSGGVLPLYKPSTSGPGTLGSIPLATTSSGTPLAPVAGVFSSDDSTFFVGTSGDNAIHLITPSTMIDNPTKVIAPKLPGINGGIVAPNLLVQKPRSAIS